MCVCGCVGCGYGDDAGYGCGNCYLVAEPKVAYGRAHYVPSMHRQPQACSCCCALAPTSYSETKLTDKPYGQQSEVYGRCTARVGQRTCNRKVYEQCMYTRRWTDDATREIIITNIPLINRSLGQLDTATQAPRPDASQPPGGHHRVTSSTPRRGSQGTKTPPHPPFLEQSFTKANFTPGRSTG